MEEMRGQIQTYTDLSQVLKEPDKVQVLDLSNRGLTEIPVEIFQLASLTQLYLYENQIGVIPDEEIVDTQDIWSQKVDQKGC